ncbi:MAG: ATPase, T2SS/T4P/T4SS family [bacterium]|nr:ATPase, T2SS/T4P/T4SS family [bacterium]
MRVDPKQLKAFMIDGGLATEEQLTRAVEEAERSKKKFRDVLLDLGIISKDKLTKLEAYILGIPYADLTREAIAPEILQIIPEPIARKYNIVSFKKRGNELHVAMLDPEDLQTIEFIRKKSNLTILPRLTNAESIKHVLTLYQKSLSAEFGDIIQKETKDLRMVNEKSGEEDVGDLRKIAEDLPIVRIVDTLVKHAILQRASDIHVEPYEHEVIVRYRIDGVLHDAMTLPKQVHAGLIARIKVLSSLRLDEHRLPQDGRFKVETDDYKVSFRVSILPVYDGEKIVMRLLPEDSKGYTLENLGFRGLALEILHRNIQRPHGMILVTGPTGSGKTTTLYTVLDILNTPDVNISTIEDPIEYRMQRINQTQVRPEIGLTFGSGLRSLVRQDPDIIMVGEIRDQETADMAVNAALTGHLVLSTLHTNSAAGAMPRLIDMKVEPFLIASTVNVIVAQRLVRKLWIESAETHTLSAAEIANLKKVADLDRIMEILKREKIVPSKTTWETIEFKRPKPAPESPDGFKGRVGIYEVLDVNEPVRELIQKNATGDELERHAKGEQGMVTMLEDGFIKAVQGVTSLQEVLVATQE